MAITKKIKKNFDLSRLTTFRIGGSAEFFITVKNSGELVEAVNWAKNNNLPLIFLAGGSNLLITREKISGLVVKISGNDFLIKGPIVTAWPGTGLTRLAKATFEAGLSGLEWALGIPGSLGGAVRGNAGAYGSEIAKSVIGVETYNLKDGQFLNLNRPACGFAYRHSVFKENKDLLIVGVKLKLIKDRPDPIKQAASSNLRHRLKSNPKEPSAGCIFKNIKYADLARENFKLAAELSDLGLVRGGKVATAYLIEQLGLKGYAIGGAKISEQHANFIVNCRQATAADVVKLIKLIKRKVKSKYQINLTEEIQYL